MPSFRLLAIIMVSIIKIIRANMLKLVAEPATVIITTEDIP